MTPRSSLLSIAATTTLLAAPSALALPHFWDGTDLTLNADGGSGIWDAGLTANWDDLEIGGLALPWPLTGTDNDVIFGGAAGTVTIEAAGVAANDLSFLTTSYTLGGGMLTLNNTTQNTIMLGSGISAAISSSITATAGNVTLSGGTLDFYGNYTGGAKNFTVSGATLNLTSPAFTLKKFVVGAGVGSSPATVNMSSGSVTTSNDYVGAGDGVDGTINVSGGTFTLGTNATALFLGTGPVKGTMNVTGGTVAVTNGATYIGAGYNGSQTTTSTGELTISGTGTFTHGGAGAVKLTNVAGQTGTVNLLSGGTFNINGSAITKGAGNATFYFDGGVLRQTANSANLFTGGLNPVVNAGGVILNSNGFNSTISTNLTAGTGNGGLKKQGAGTLFLAGANAYTGKTEVEGGNLIATLLTSVPRYNVAGEVTVAAGTAFGGRIGPANLSEADFAALVAEVDFAPDARLAVDTAAGAVILTQDLGTLTKLGTAVNVAKVSANALTLDMAGQSFTGNINVSGGTLILDTTGTESYAGNITGNQTLTVQGTGSTLSLTGSSTIGTFNKNGTGTLEIPSGSLTLAGSQNFYAHQGTVHQTGGSVNTGAYTVIGRTAGLAAEYVIDGGVFNANGGGTPRNMVISEQGSTGVLTINGGTVNANNSTAGSAIGGKYYGILMTGTAADNATLNLNGGTLLLSRVTALDVTAPSVFNFNGGLLKANNTFSDFMQGLSRANVRDGGAVIDTNGNDITIYQNLLHSDISGDASIDGGVTKLGAGSLQLAGYNEYTGDTVVGEGSLTLYDAFLHDESHVSIAAGATLDLQSGMEDTVKTLIIGGVPAAPGTWGAVDSVDADFTTPAITGSGLLNVTALGTASAYDAWAAGKGLAGPNALASADPDGDGASNMLEFALNGDPGDGSDPGLTHASIQDASAPAGSELTLTIAVRDGATFAAVNGAQVGTASGYTYTVQGTQDLGAYNSAVSHVSVSDTAPGLPSLAGTAWEYHTFKLDASEGLPGKGFLRVKVEIAP